MEARKLVFPIVLAMVWVAMAAMAMVDFASFSAATQPGKVAIAAVTPATPTHLLAAHF
jgi:hypothetical protein